MVYYPKLQLNTLDSRRGEEGARVAEVLERERLYRGAWGQEYPVRITTPYMTGDRHPGLNPWHTNDKFDTTCDGVPYPVSP